QPDMEQRGGVILVELQHALEFAQRVLVHVGPVERDAEVAMLVRLPFGNRLQVHSAVATDAMNESRGEQSIQRLAHLELHETGRFDHARDVAPPIEVLEYALLLTAEWKIGRRELAPVRVEHHVEARDLLLNLAPLVHAPRAFE